MSFVENEDLFRSTREHSVNVLSDELTALRQETNVHINADSLSYAKYIENPEIIMSDSGILEVLGKTSKESKVGVLNMMVGSQIYQPLDGLSTFDSLVLTSNLFEAINSPAVLKYFFEVAGKDRLVYSKRVTFFRDKEMNMLSKQDYYRVDVCTAILNESDVPYMQKQFKGVLKLMLFNEVDTFVVSSRGISQTAAQALIRVLSEYHFIKKIIFTDCSEDFKREFAERYMRE